MMFSANIIPKAKMRRFSLLIVLLFNIYAPSVCTLNCAQHDQSSLLQLKHSLVFDSYGSSKLGTWNSSSDCCVWSGITCNPSGDVIGLDLGDESIKGGIDDSNSSLFDLIHLQRLDLSWNHFDGSLIPSGIGKLVNLLHLNLSYSGFGKLENPRFSTLVQNLTSLIELKLDGVNMSAESEGYRWGSALSSSLPNLQILWLSQCSLSSVLPDFLANFSNLTSLILSYNNLLGPLPEFIGNMTKLELLSLSGCGFSGSITHIRWENLESLADLYLSDNKLLSGTLPGSIGNMTKLEYLDLEGCGFSGSITHIHWENFESLDYLDLSSNKLLSGPLPEFIGNMTKLEFLRLDGCGFSGSITHIRWENLESLVRLSLSDNVLTGSIPLSLFSLPSMYWLDLSSNRFSGQLGVVEDSANLEYLDLGSNKLEGPIPKFILNIHSLESLKLSQNNFSGTIDLTNLFQNLGNLSEIDLSFNSLSIIQSVGFGSSTIMSSSFPSYVNLASCNLKEFPGVLRNQSLASLDLSNNQIYGLIPNWILEFGDNIWLSSVDLSHNYLIGFETLLPNFTSYLGALNLKSNTISGQIPLEFGNFSRIQFMSLSNNNFHGSIPLSLCNVGRDGGDNEVVVDLSNNSLSGTIPPCLLEMNSGVLNLKRNNLSGSIPDAFRGNCSLETLDLSDNRLQGTIPESMVNCKALKVINLGSNDLSGGFPCWLRHLSNLTVLVLRSNRFYGSVRCALSNTATNSWSKLQIIDIAANSFGGELPFKSFRNWETMMRERDAAKPKLDYLKFGYYYQDTVAIINKGVFMEFEKILIAYNVIDFSCNHFEGSIPHSVGDLKSLYALNLSHNHFTGSIPPSIGNLKVMESLDLADNGLSGSIPEQLASLTFLSYLNLSFNHLVGKIPTSTQLQSFSASSYTGNKGLYGPPLNIDCLNACGPHGPPVDPSLANDDKGIDWQLICTEIGFVVGLGSVIGSFTFWKRWRLWCFERIDRLIFKIFPSLDPHKTSHGRRVRKRSLKGNDDACRWIYVKHIKQ